MKTFAVAFKYFLGSISALQWYTPLLSMVIFDNSKVLLITVTTAGLLFVLLMIYWASWRQRKHLKILTIHLSADFQCGRKKTKAKQNKK